tara:strand:- start:5773 stop:6195 length:423 start_codon:yes stop_codon:yes gene_type:complete
LIRISSSFHRRPLVQPVDTKIEILFLFYFYIYFYLLHLSLRVVHVCERIPALSRVFSVGAILSHRFFRGIGSFGEKDSNLQDNLRTSRQQKGNKTRGVWWVFVFTIAPSDAFGFCDAEHASSGLGGRDEVVFFRWFCRGQ